MGTRVRLVGLAAFVYHDRYANKPHTLDDYYASSDSGAYLSDEALSRRISQVDCSGIDLSSLVCFGHTSCIQVGLKFYFL